MRSLRALAPVLAVLSLAASASAQWGYGQTAAFDSLAQFGTNCGFGQAVDLDGDTALVGVPHPNAGGVSGAAVVYRKVAGVWTQEATLAPSDPTTGNYFGWSVALDGDIAVVGAPFGNQPSVNGAGAAYVFTRSGTTWTQQQKMSPSDPLSNSHFGWSVALDGATALVGAPQATYGTDGGRGAVYTFDFGGSAWTQGQKLAGSGTVSGSRNGGSVAIDGDRLVLGAHTDPHFVTPTSVIIQVGSGWVFERAGSVWTEQGKLLMNPPVPQATLGISAALEGDRIVLGAYGENFFEGAAYVFQKSGASWVQTARLDGAGCDAQDGFGNAVALSGQRIAVGAYNYDSATPQGNGCVKLFVHDGAAWTEELELLGHPMFTGDTLGEAVAIQGDTVVGGSPSLAFGQLGRAWIWEVDPLAVETYCTAKINSQGCTPAIGWSGFASVTSASPFLVTASQVLTKKPGLLFYGYASFAAPFQGGVLCVAPAVKRTAVQTSTGTLPTTCFGTYSYDLNARIQSGVDPALVAGVDVYCQYWSRDLGSPSSTGLTDALRARIQP